MPLKVLTSSDRLEVVLEGIRAGKLPYRNPQQAERIARLLCPERPGRFRASMAFLMVWGGGTL